MSDMEWTELTPTEPGAYWVLTSLEVEPFLAEVHNSFGRLRFERAGCSQDLAIWARDMLAWRPYWFGPFKCPPVEADAIKAAVQASARAAEERKEFTDFCRQRIDELWAELVRSGSVRQTPA